jgi:hypothetical protein
LPKVYYEVTAVNALWPQFLTGTELIT